MEKLQQKYGKNPAEWNEGDESEESESSSEDEDAQLLTAKAERKYKNLLLKI